MIAFAEIVFLLSLLLSKRSYSFHHLPRPPTRTTNVYNIHTIMTDEKPLVVITGVTGYLGSQTCLAFLKDGSYRVRGTVRSTTNEAKLKPLKDGFGEEWYSQLSDVRIAQLVGHTAASSF